MCQNHSKVFRIPSKTNENNTHVFLLIHFYSLCLFLVSHRFQYTSSSNIGLRLYMDVESQQDLHVEFCKGARQSGLVSVWQHTLVGQ